MKIEVTTRDNREIIDLTEEVASRAAGSADGIILLSAPHTTVALFVSELDDDLRKDFVKIADRLFAPIRPFAHIKKNNPNTEAHVLSAMFGTSLVLPVQGGKISLGTYQRILMFELDGPKTRTVTLTRFQADAG
jgi:secondary thiamine-phosphate synthase enzyme